MTAASSPGLAAAATARDAKVVGAVAVTRLVLTAFRNYPDLRLSVDPRPVAITGPNGAGKTNLLEALSFLAPGRGLRGARPAAVTCQASAALRWAVAAHVLTPDGGVDVGTGLAPPANGQAQDKRVVQIDGVAQRGQAALARRLGVVWLTPAMDRLFADGPAARRKFLDRLIIAFDPDHAGRTAAYDRALRQRARLLRDGGRDAAWFAALEDTLARYGVAVAAARSHMIERLNRSLAGSNGPFPSADLALAGEVDAWLEAMPAIDAEDRLRAALARGRSGPVAADAGPHRSDVNVIFRRPGHASHGQPAHLCSTGEQKALLVAIVLAQARLQAAKRGHAPLLLLDEVAAHLDAERRAGLFQAVLGLGAQAWMTGTDAGVFDGLDGAVQRLVAGGGTVRF